MKPAHPITQARADAARTAPYWQFAPLTCPVQQQHQTAFQRALQAGTLAVAALAMAGCGGGDADEDGRATTPPLDCKATPALCT